MSDIAIKVESLSKRYRIGLKEKMHDTLYGALISWVKAPFSNFSNLLKLTRFDEQYEKEDIVWALRDVSFEVEHGKVIGIIGRNGAGKSTLLKVLSRITEPTSGKVTLNGRVSSLLEVGTGFHQELTGRENIYLNGTVLGMSKAEIDRKFDEIVAFSEVERFLDTPVKRYSSGMKVRLAFAVAAHLEPEILLVDEVLAVGDAGFQKKCLGKMEDVAREGRTVLFVSHNMPAITQLCSHCILLEEGYLKKTGLTSEIISHYLAIGSTLASETSISKRTDRKGSGHAKFLSLQVFTSDVNLKAADIILSGQDIIFKIGYRVEPKNAPLKNVTTGIQIFSGNGTFLFAMNNHVKNQAFPILEGEGYLYCKMPRCPLMPGTHYLTLVMNDNNGIVDLVEQAAVLNVEAGDFYGTGTVNSYGRQGLFVDHQWAETPEEIIS